MFDISAFVESAARDCDGMHYSGPTEYRMEDAERNGEFGDMEFYDRIATMMFSPFAVSGRLTVSQDDNGLPMFEWSEDTEEGFRNMTATFRRN